MEAKGFPTSADIYLELDGKKIAVVQGYTARATKSSQSVEAFGESEPVATIEGQRKYVLELTRLYATDDAISDGINFYELKDFSLVICKPDRRIIYSGCEWSAIEEDGQLNAMVAEKITVEDPLERTLLCNARVLAACCYREGAPAFADEEEVLTTLTGRQMERLLERLASQTEPADPAAMNPAFDAARFDALQKEAL